MAIKHNLECLAQIANRHDELEKDIQGFFGEAFFNILNILSECGDKLPGNGKDTGVRIEIIKQGAVVEGRSRDRGAAVRPIPVLSFHNHQPKLETIDKSWPIHRPPR